MIERQGIIYRSKQEAFDHLEECRKAKKPILGLEVVAIQGQETETSMYKTVWFRSQRGVYSAARNFIQKQMGGTWSWIEFKS